jgi:hypothetical protein
MMDNTAMTLDEFWKLVDASRRGAENCDEQVEKLKVRLKKLPPAEIVAFDKLLAKLRRDSYRWDLWAVAYIAFGGCSDDAFDYFRGWLIAQGRKYFEAAMINPEFAAKRVTPGEEEEIECESMLYVADAAYEEVVGKPIPSKARSSKARPTGRTWEEDDLERLHPKLWKKFT